MGMGKGGIDMEQRSLQRLAWIAGLVFAVLILIGAFAPGTGPKPDAAPDAVRRFMVDKEGILRVGGYLQALSQVAFLIFLSGIVSFFSRAEGEPPILSRVVFGGGIVASALSLASLVPAAALVYVSGTAARTGDDTIQLVWSTG